MSKTGLTRRAATVLAALTASPVMAQQVRAGADVTVAAGAASNPFLQADPDGGTAFVDGVIAPGVTISDERGSASIGGYLRGTAYLNNGYDPTWAIGASARADRAVDQRLSVRGALQVDSLIIGERFNSALLTAPSFTPVVQPTQPGATPTATPPVVVQPIVLPPQFIGTDVTLLGIRQRQTTFGGSAGLSYRLSARDSISADLQAQRSVTGGGFFSFTSYGGTVGYSRSLSELTQVGARLSSQWIRFDDGGSGEVYQPQLTLDTQLGPLWRLSAGAGLFLSKSRTVVSRGSSTGLSANVRLCRDGERSELCLRGSRDAAPNSLAVVTQQLNLGASYSLILGEAESVRASVDYSRVSTPGVLIVPGGAALQDDVSFVNATAAYDRPLNRRLRAGVSANYRDAGGGFGAGSDVSASVFLSARLGAIR